MKEDGWPDPLDLLRGAVVAILDESNRLLGTGSFVSRDGIVLTAYHVVEGEKNVIIRTGTGQLFPAIVEDDCICRSKDLAVICCNADGVPFLSIGLLNSYCPKSYLSVGFQFANEGVPGGVFLSGKVGGRTTINLPGAPPEHQITALDLPDPTIAQGSSGAPVFDPATRSVVGVMICAKEHRVGHDFAVPLDHELLEVWPRFRLFAEANDLETPRFGELINKKGREIVCHALVASAVKFAESAGLYRRNKTIQRESYTSALEDFFSSTNRVFPLIGRPGVGKSTVLLWTAENEAIDAPIRLLLRGADIVPQQDGLKGLIKKTIDRYLPPSRRHGTELDADAIVTRSSGIQDMTVLLDGLNEANVSMEELITHWIPESLSWLRDRRVKLVISCRSEYWQAISSSFPKNELYFSNEKFSGNNSNIEEDRDLKEHTEISLSNIPKKITPYLDDFTTQEASAALEIYGLEGSLTPDEATHPFILAMAESLASEAYNSFSDFSRTLDEFIKYKIVRSVSVVGKITWMPIVNELIDIVASNMIDNNTQIIANDDAYKIFKNYEAALDGLVSENLLLLDLQGYRFQHDHVREFLQARQIDIQKFLKQVKYVDTTKYVNEGLTWSNIIPAIISQITTVPIHKVPALSPSVASFALIRAIEESSPTDYQCALDNLFEATKPAKYVSRPGWYKDTTALLIRRFNPDIFQNNEILEWIIRLLKTDYTDAGAIQPPLIKSIIISIRRSNLSFQEKIELLPYVFYQELEISWCYLRLPIGVSFETLNGKQPRDFSNFVECEAAELIQSLIEKDLKGLIEGLGNLLSNTYGGNRSNRNGASFLSVAALAARCLYKLRKFDLRNIVLMAIGSFSDEAKHLLKALAYNEPDVVAPICLNFITNMGRDNELFYELLWCAGHSRILYDLDYDGRLVHTLKKMLVEEKSVHKIWIIKIFLQQYSHMFTLYEKNEDFRRKFEFDIGRLSVFARSEVDNILRRLNDIPSDVSFDELKYSIDLFRDVVLERVKDAINSSHKLLHLEVRAVTYFVSPIDLNNLDKRDSDKSAELRRRYSEAIKMLSIYAKTRGDDGIYAVASFAISKAQSWHNESGFNFTADDVVNLGILDLACQVLESGCERAYESCTGMLWPEAGVIRERLFTAIMNSNITNRQFEDMIYSFCGSHCRWKTGSFEELLGFRSSGRENLWDKALLRFMNIYSCDEHIAAQTVNYWKLLSDLQLSESSSEFLAWLELYHNINEAAHICASATPDYKAHILKHFRSQGLNISAKQFEKYKKRLFTLPLQFFVS